MQHLARKSGFTLTQSIGQRFAEMILRADQKICGVVALQSFKPQTPALLFGECAGVAVVAGEV